MLKKKVILGRRDSTQISLVWAEVFLGRNQIEPGLLKTISGFRIGFMTNSICLELDTYLIFIKINKQINILSLAPSIF